jgi:RNA polymerase sigma-70 factor (ECF subfamily)
MTVPAGAIVEEALPIARAAEDALETLVREHARLVYRVCYSVLRHAEDSEDAAQETFIRVMRNLKKLPEVRDPRAWLARIAWRVALDRRRASPEMSLEDAAAAVTALRDSGASADDLAAGHELSALLERLIASLPEELRAPLVLSTVEEMTAADVAAVLDIPEASVRTRVFRARQLLREKLGGVLEKKS